MEEYSTNQPKNTLPATVQVLVIPAQLQTATVVMSHDIPAVDILTLTLL